MCKLSQCPQVILEMFEIDVTLIHNAYRYYSSHATFTGPAVRFCHHLRLFFSAGAGCRLLINILTVAQHASDVHG